MHVAFCRLSDQFPVVTCVEEARMWRSVNLFLYHSIDGGKVHQESLEIVGIMETQCFEG